MKKLLLLFTIVILASCSNDDAQSTSYTGSLIGAWKNIRVKDTAGNVFVDGDCDKPSVYPPLTMFVFTQTSLSLYNQCRNEMYSTVDYTFSDSKIYSVPNHELIYSVKKINDSRLELTLTNPNNTTQVYLIEKQ